MKISTTTGNLAKLYGEEEAIRMLAKAGFDSMDYSMFIHNAETGIYNTNEFTDYAKKLKKVADDAGITFGQFHAQIPNPSVPDYMSRTELWDKLAKNAIIAASIVECPYVVVHPLILPERRYDDLYQENFDLNLEYYGKMKDTLKKYGVKVAIENMWHWDDSKNTICPSVCSSAEEMRTLAETLGDEFVTCLDVGHAVLTGRTAESMVYTLGDRLATLHVHDNDAKDDTHDLMFNANPINMMFPDNPNRIDWDKFMIALKDVGYKGTFSLEADNFIKKYPDEMAFDAVCFMAKVARYLVDKHGL